MSDITDSGIIVNEIGGGKAANPWECDDYIHTVKTMLDGKYVSTVSWEMTGDVPLDLSIDIGGVISGKIKPLTKEQPSVSDFFPVEDIKEDGSNWEMTGRYKNATHTFNFTVIWTYLELVDPALPPVPVTKSKPLSIMVVKNNDIDNLIFSKMYLEAGWQTTIGEKKYTKDNIDEFLQDHPGPFSNGC